jgi:hypothetical protein
MSDTLVCSKQLMERKGGRVGFARTYGREPARPEKANAPVERPGRFRIAGQAAAVIHCRIFSRKIQTISAARSWLCCA